MRILKQKPTKQPFILTKLRAEGNNASTIPARPLHDAQIGGLLFVHYLQRDTPLECGDPAPLWIRAGQSVRKPSIRPASSERECMGNPPSNQCTYSDALVCRPEPNGLTYKSPWQRHGNLTNEVSQPEGLLHKKFPNAYNAALQATSSQTRIPMALPWAGMKEPVGLAEPDAFCLNLRGNQMGTKLRRFLEYLKNLWTRRSRLWNRSFTNSGLRSLVHSVNRTLISIRLTCNSFVHSN